MKSDFFPFSPFIIKNGKKKWNGFFFLFWFHDIPVERAIEIVHWSRIPSIPQVSSLESPPLPISTTSCAAPSLQKVNAKVKLPTHNQKLYAAPSKSKVWAQRELRSFPTGFSSISLFFTLHNPHSQCPVPLAWQSSRSCRAVGTHSSQRQRQNGVSNA